MEDKESKAPELLCISSPLSDQKELVCECESVPPNTHSFVIPSAIPQGTAKEFCFIQSNQHNIMASPVLQDCWLECNSLVSNLHVVIPAIVEEFVSTHGKSMTEFDLKSSKLVEPPFFTHSTMHALTISSLPFPENDALELNHPKIYSHLNSCNIIEADKMATLNIRDEEEIETMMKTTIEINKQNLNRQKTTRNISKARRVLLLVACGVMFSIYVGITSSMAVVFSELLHSFRESKSEVSLVYSLCIGVSTLTCSISGMVLSRFGLCVCLFLGGLISAAGLAGAAFVHSFPALIVLVGVVSELSAFAAVISVYRHIKEETQAKGIGFSFINVGAISGAVQSFSSKHSLILVPLAGGLSTTICPSITAYLIDLYGWRGNFLFFAGFALHACPLSLLFKTNKVVQTKKLTKEGNNKQKQGLQIITNKLFLGFLALMLLCGLTLPVLALFMVDYGLEKGFDISTATLWLTVFNVSALFMRMILLPAVSLPRFSALFMYITTILLTGGGYIAFPFIWSHAGNITMIAFLGSLYGGFSSVSYLVTLDLAEPTSFSFGLSLQNTFFGVGSIVSCPFAGYLADITGTYTWPMVIEGIIILLAASVLSLVVVVTKSKISANLKIECAKPYLIGQCGIQFK